MISMPCVLLTVLLNTYCYRYQDVSDKFWKSRYYKKCVFPINTSTRFFQSVSFYSVAVFVHCIRTCVHVCMRITINFPWSLQLGRNQICRHYPAGILRNNDVFIASKRCHFYIITSKWRRFHVITTLLLRHVFRGSGPGGCHDDSEFGLMTTLCHYDH